MSRAQEKDNTDRSKYKCFICCQPKKGHICLAAGMFLFGVVAGMFLVSLILKMESLSAITPDVFRTGRILVLDSNAVKVNILSTITPGRILGPDSHAVNFNNLSQRNFTFFANVNNTRKHAETNIENIEAVADYFITRDDERRRPFAGSSSPGFAQPIPQSASGRVANILTAEGFNVSHSLCFYLRTVSGGPCGRGSLGYTHVRKELTFSCGDVLEVPGRAGCSAGFGGPRSAVLYIDGPTFVLHRTTHYPHFLEEVASGANWLFKNNISYFSAAVIDESGGTCETHAGYRSGSWAPSGSPVNESLQIAMMKTIAKVIVFPWSVRKGKSVCVGKPWRDPTLESKRHSERFFGHPSICSRFRKRAMDLFGIAEPEGGIMQRVLVLQRPSGGRVVTNLADLMTLGLQKELNLTFRYSTLDGMSAKEQFTEFARAGVVVAHHGAALALAVLMKPGSLIIEIFNYQTSCDFVSSLVISCGVQIAQVFKRNGTNYGPHRCNGNNRKDGSDDNSVDLTEISKILHNHLKLRRRNDGNPLETGPNPPIGIPSAPVHAQA
jgi:hypothetical protein